MTKLNKIASGRIAKEAKRNRNPENTPASVLRVTENDLKNVSVSDDDKLKVEQEIRSQTMRTLHDDEILTEIFDSRRTTAFHNLIYSMMGLKLCFSFAPFFQRRIRRYLHTISLRTQS